MFLADAVLLQGRWERGGVRPSNPDQNETINKLTALASDSALFLPGDRKRNQPNSGLVDVAFHSRQHPWRTLGPGRGLGCPVQPPRAQARACAQRGQCSLPARKSERTR